MEAQLRYQNVRSAGPIQVPAPIRWLTPAVVVLVLVYAALPLLMAINRDATATSITRNAPGLNPAYLELAVNSALVYTAGLHALSCALVLWFLVKVRQGRRWGRIALTGYLVFATLASFFSAVAGPEYQWAVISGNVIHLVIGVMLWMPSSVRDFFRAHRLARTSASTM